MTKCFMSPYIDHEKLYVDAGSGVPVQQEMQGRPVNGKRPHAPKDIPKRVVTFCLDPSLTIEPP